MMKAQNESASNTEKDTAHKCNNNTKLSCVNCIFTKLKQYNAHHIATENCTIVNKQINQLFSEFHSPIPPIIPKYLKNNDSV